MKLHRLIFRDSEIFPDPYAFKPERFLGDEGARPREILNMVWGLGRRYIDRELLLNYIFSNCYCLTLEPAPVDNSRRRRYS